jgi:hypothetical protein
MLDERLKEVNKLVQPQSQPSVLPGPILPIGRIGLHRDANAQLVMIQTPPDRRLDLRKR